MKSCIKRLFDFFVALILLVVLSPIMLLLYFLILFKLGKPVIFKQKRPGKNTAVFNMFKFRTMLNSKDLNGNDLPDAERLTNFGKLLRSTSLDELPGLWNVLKGDMSLVGPRPLLIEYIPLYSEEQSRRHEVKPGITGWAQVNGRNAISWDEKFKLDVWYVDNHNFFIDLKILFLTIKKVLVREGISAQDHVSIEKFTGNEQ
jgi:sugar transferase EpsL